MDIADLILNNRTLRRILLMALLLLSCGTLFALFGSAYCADHIITQQIRTTLGILGGARFTDASPSQEQIENGLQLMEQYGVSQSMPPRLMAQWEPLRWQLFAVMLTVFSIPVLIMAIGCMTAMIREYRRLEKLQAECLLISEGKSAVEMALASDSDSIGRVAQGIARIAQQMRHMRGTLQSEKKALAEFLTDLSHQLKTVLAVIRLNSDLLAAPALLTSSERTQLTEEVGGQLAHMETLLRSALKLAKLEAGAVEYHMQTSALLPTCRAAADTLAPLLRSHNISLTLDETDTILLHDPPWLREALENIMKNAIDHAECTAIRMAIEANTVWSKITIQDNGKGIPQEEIPRLFKRFGKKSNSNDMQSVGIGLAIAKKIVTSHGGEITVFSSPEEGTRFELIFLK